MRKEAESGPPSPQKKGHASMKKLKTSTLVIAQLLPLNHEPAGPMTGLLTKDAYMADTLIWRQMTWDKRPPYKRLPLYKCGKANNFWRKTLYADLFHGLKK